MMTYYTNVAHTIVYRFDDGNPEYYDLTVGKWAHCPELWDIFVGELDVDDLTEDEANALISDLISKRNSRASA